MNNQQKLIFTCRLPSLSTFVTCSKLKLRTQCSKTFDWRIYWGNDHKYNLYKLSWCCSAV